MKLPLMYKYKPSTLQEFKMDANLYTILLKMIELDTLNIILMGGPGTGKSCLINLIIKEYYKSDSNDNILMLNNLKEQGIQFYRTDVKYFCQTTCTSGKKKMIIIDDIDMINEQNQQLFINYINKYPNIHFVATGTNSQKIMEGIQSRLVSLKLHALSPSNLKEILTTITTTEHIDIDADAQETILSIANGSARMLINYLEKFKLLEQTITNKMVDVSCTNIRFSTFNSYTTFVLDHNHVDACKIMNTIHREGYSGIDILDNYFLYIKASTLADTMKYKIIKILCKYITIFNQIHEHPIELMFFTLEICAI
jgi:replication-associated recombination protein RarA